MDSFRGELLSKGLAGDVQRIDLVLSWLVQQNICCLRDLVGLTEFQHFARGGRFLTLPCAGLPCCLVCVGPLTESEIYLIDTMAVEVTEHFESDPSFGLEQTAKRQRNSVIEQCRCMYSCFYDVRLASRCPQAASRPYRCAKRPCSAARAPPAASGNKLALRD